MSEDPVNQASARVVKESTAKHEGKLPTDIEVAWQEWLRGVGKVDARTKQLLRAAFEVGIEAGKSTKT